jgi:ABC-type sugar transport system ATPase subunit
VRLAAEGLGVVLISSEHEEIMELAHRAYLVSEGRTIDEIVPTTSSVEDVLFRLFNASYEQDSKDDTRNQKEL